MNSTKLERILKSLFEMKTEKKAYLISLYLKLSDNGYAEIFVDKAMM